MNNNEFWLALAVVWGVYEIVHQIIERRWPR